MAAPLEPIEGKYEILEKIHEGGMGSIYKVRHRLLDSIRVIKTLRPQLAADVEFQQRFLREARLAIRLDHPNIAKLFDFSIADNGMGFIVMEYISGLSLRQILQGMGPPDLPLTLEIAHQTLEALGFLHRQGYVHRDVAPDNLMLTLDGDRRPRVQLIDLGIAKSLSGGDDLTAAGQFLGKARYSSPEHFGERGATGIDARSDVYSFGGVLYELLTGRTPIEGSDLRSLSAGHLYRPPVPFAESDPAGSVPEDLRRIVLRALEKPPEDRFPDTAVFGEALDHVRLRFPLPALDFEKLFEQIRASREVVQSYRSLRTQVELDQQFGLETTPTRGIFDGRFPPSTVSLDLPAPEAVVARLDELAGAAESPPATAAGAAAEADAAQADPNGTLIVTEEALRGAQPAGQEERRKTRRVDPAEIPGTQPIPTLGAPPATTAPDDDYQTESTFLPAVEPPQPAVPASRPPPPRPPPPEAATRPMPVPRAAVEDRPAAAAGAPPRERRKLAAIAAAALAVAGLLAVVFGGGRSGDERAATGGTAPRAALGVPEESRTWRDEDAWLAASEIHPALGSGRDCLIAGDLLCAVIALKAVEAESLSLAPQELELLGDLRIGLAAGLGGEAADTRDLGERLVDALQAGPVTELRDAFDAIVELREVDPDSFGELAEPFARAGEIVGVWRRMWRLKRSGDPLGVVGLAAELAEAYPPYADAARAHRDEAAETIEAQAEALAAAGDVGTARARLAELARALPERAGLRARIAALERRLSEGREIEAVIGRAEAALAASDPHRGLELLDQLSGSGGSRYASRVADLRERLQRRLLDMDRETPTIREAAEAEYRRNDPATIPLEIRDDYRVDSVRAWARGGKEGHFTEVAVRHDGGDGYVVEVPPAVHDNKRNLEFYVWVADRSGHTATLGTESEPQSLRRKGLF